MNNLYRKIFIILAFSFLYTSYASAKDVKPGKDAKPEEESSTYIQDEILNKKDYYISFDVGMTNSFSHIPYLMRIKYGRYFSRQAFFELGFSFRPYTHRKNTFYLMTVNMENDEFYALMEKEDFNHFLPFIDITYGYDFIKNGKWIPGIDTSLFIKPLHFSEEYTEVMINGGIELGLYLKAFLSKSCSVFLRPGLVFDSEYIIDFYDYRIMAFLNLGFQGYF